MLFNTAGGVGLSCKLICYWFEVYAGLCIIFSHLTIWIYSIERDLDLQEHLTNLEADDVKEDEPYESFLNLISRHKPRSVSSGSSKEGQQLSNLKSDVKENEPEPYESFLKLLRHKRTGVSSGSKSDV